MNLQAGSKELIWVMRGVVVVVGFAATIIALMVPKTYGLLVFCADFQYVSILPQLTSAVYLPKTNAYGSVAAFWFGFTLRILSGAPLIGLPTVLYWPYAEGETQLFPFRTVIVLLSMTVFVSVSFISKYAVENIDIFNKIDRHTFQIMDRHIKVKVELFGDDITQDKFETAM